MNSSQKAVLRFFYSLRKWPHKLIILLFLPIVCALLVFSFLSQRPSGYIASAVLELKLHETYRIVSVNDSQSSQLALVHAELAQQMARQIKTPRLLYILGCKLSIEDLKDEETFLQFQEKIGLSSQALLDHLLANMENQDLQKMETKYQPATDSLIELSLKILENEQSNLESKIHLQWIPESRLVRLKVHDANQQRGEFIANTLSQLAIRYQEEIGSQIARTGIEAQKLLINQRRNSWEASRERLKLEQDELNSGRGPNVMREISRKIFALKRSLVETEKSINGLRKRIREKREKEENAPYVISVRNDQKSQESLILELSKALNKLRIINTELKALQEKLKKYEEKHLRKFWEQEKGARKALLEAQEYLKVVMKESAANLVEMRMIEDAKTNLPASSSIWILSIFSFLATLALWLIFLLRIRYFRQ